MAGNLISKSGMPMGFAAGSNKLCGITISTCSTGAGSGTGLVSYDASGNITRYTRPTAAQAPNVPGADGATLDLLNYSAFNLPLHVTKTVGGAVTASGEFFYDAGYQRVRQVKRSGPIGTGATNFVDDILYVVPGGFEVHRNALGQVTSSIATISGPDGTVATITTNFDVASGLPVASVPGVGSVTNSTSAISGLNTVTKLVLKDHLGSMTAEATIRGTVDGAGRVTVGSVSVIANGVVVHGFGPWGNARNSASPLAEGQRGFTGHEHLAELGLIHMNGRIYDPVIGRFLQADPIIQAPHNAQSHNRYSYVMNNPLSLTDPSGFSWWTKHRRQIIGIVAGILTAGAATWAMGAYALANGATIFASASGALNGLGMATAAAAGGFASGGIMGGNIQSALRGAFTAFVTAGVLQGIGDMMSGGVAQSGAEISQGVQNYQMGAPTANLDVPITSDAGGGMGSSMPTEIPRLVEKIEVTGCCKPWYSGIRDWYRSSVVSFQSATVADTFNKALGGWPAAGAIAAVSKGASAASTVSRGLSHHGGTFTTTANQAGGRIITSTGNIAQKDFGTYVQSGVMRGEQVNILSGVHGEISGVMRADMSLFHADVLKFGQYPGVNVYNMTELLTNPLQLRTILNSPGTTIGGFCNSSVCLTPFMR
jgi:RHS repeat-associated protein